MASALMALSCAALFYTFAGYPALLACLAAVFGKKTVKGAVTPRVSLIISAYNEEGEIRRKLDNTLELDYPGDRLEIIVASESGDGTNGIVKEYADRGVKLFDFKGREGKRATLFRTVPLATGEIIVFSDANAMYRKDAVRKLVMNFADERVGCVSGRLRYLPSGDSTIGDGESAYWEYDFVLKSLAGRLQRLGGCGGVNGSIFAIRKELYNPIDRHRGDDFEISCRIEIGGRGVVMEPDALSFEPPSATAGLEFKRKVRLATWNIKSTLMLLREAAAARRPLTAFLLFSHRLMRYTTPVWLVTLLASSAALSGGWPRYLLYAQVVFYSAALAGFMTERAGRKAGPLLIVPFYFSMVNCAAMIGLIKNVTGRTDRLWEKAR